MHNRVCQVRTSIPTCPKGGGVLPQQIWYE